MMKTFTAIALALLLGAGVGYGVFAYMTPKADPTISAPVAQTAEAVATETANIEPAAEEKVHGADDPVVAKVDGKPLYRSDVADFTKSLPQQMQQAELKDIFPMALEQVISAKIVDEKASAINMENNPAYIKRMADAKTQIARAVFVEEAIEKQFTDADVKKAYDEIVKNMPKVDEVHARHILVETEAQAKDIVAKLDKGAKFEDLAKEFSTDKSNSASGGDLGFFAQNDMVKEFSDAAFALKANAYTKTPVKTQFGFHVIQSLEKRVRPAPAYETVKPQVEGQVRRDILNKLVDKWRTGASVEKFDIDGKAVPAQTPEPATPAPASEAEKKAE